MQDYYFGIFKYKTASGQQSHCHLIVLSKYQIVVATEWSTNTGPSITNSYEQLINQVCKEFHLDREKTIYIEHYSKYSYQNCLDYKENAQIVKLKEGRFPTWIHLSGN